MQIILLEKVQNLGSLGDVVKVKDGYARNFLIPKGKARRATPVAIKEFEGRRAELEKVQGEKLALAQAQGEKLQGLGMQMPRDAQGQPDFNALRHNLSEAIIRQDKGGPAVKVRWWRYI